MLALDAMPTNRIDRKIVLHCKNNRICGKIFYRRDAMAFIYAECFDDFTQSHRSIEVRQFIDDTLFDIGGWDGGVAHNAPPFPEKKNVAGDGVKNSPATLHMFKPIRRLTKP